MWQDPIDEGASSCEEDGIDERHLSNTTISLECSPNNASFSGSSATGSSATGSSATDPSTTLRYRSIGIFRSCTPPLYSSDSSEMSTNPMMRRRTLRPFRFSDYYLSSTIPPCDMQGLPDVQNSENQQDTENGTPSFSQDFMPNFLGISEEDDVIPSTLISTIRDEDDLSSSESFPESTPFEFMATRRNIFSDFNNIYTPTNELYIDRVANSFLDEVSNSSADARAETLIANAKTEEEVVETGNDSLGQLMRLANKLPTPTLTGQKLAINLIKLTRCLKSPDLSELNCLNCTRIPTNPVTGKCGHSRCLSCVNINGPCPCGSNAPKNVFVNTVVQELVQKMNKYIKKPRIISSGSVVKNTEKRANVSGARPRPLVQRGSQSSQSSASTVNFTHRFSRPRKPITVQARNRQAGELINGGNFLEAASHLARVASIHPFAHVARKLLAQIITILCEENEPSQVWRKLSQSVRAQSTYSWLKTSDLECVICTSTLINPVSTPCGHTYCRSCIERSLYYQRRCALCLRQLRDFSVDETGDTQFIRSILSSIDVRPAPDDSIVIPIVTCYVAFPGMPCPLFISDPKYWKMVCNVMRSGSRRFGILAYEDGANYAEYGTVLEICDCVVFEDNRCILSTIGVSRFRIQKRFVKDGCNVARIEMLADVEPTEDDIADLQLVDAQVYYKALNWLKSLKQAVKTEIETAFGPLKYVDTFNAPNDEELCTDADGPRWLWWLITILPLKPEIKILMISTCSLLKRMMAVSRTLDVMNAESDTSVYLSTIGEPTDAPTDQRWTMGNI